MKTVAEFIEYLKTLEQDRIVLTHGYEGGYHDVTTAEEIDIKRDVNDGWYYGPHESADEYNTDVDKPIYKAYVICPTGRFM